MKPEEWLPLVPEGGNWRDLSPEIAQRVMGAAFTSGGGRTGYARRLHRGLPSPTILGSPSHRSTFLGHPIEDRAINEAEGSVIQGYPHGFSWPGSPWVQIGNAVPPLVAKAVLNELWG